MKINHPVTNREKEIHSSQTILSTTDLKGAITYVNDDFIKVSGFAKEALLGKNHNVVRHPDMPPPAFESLWSSVKAGQPWMGIVKNRCENGDHYWVDAFVMPIGQNGATVEYQSVRYKPARAWAARAEKIYKALMEGKGFKQSLSSKLSLTQKLIAGNFLALLPAMIFVFMPQFASVIPLGFLLSMVLSLSINLILMRPLRQITATAREIYDQPVMRQVYTGRDDEFGQIQLALKMQSTQINAIVGRLSDTTKKLGEIAAVTSTSCIEASQAVIAQQNELTQVATAMTEMVATVQEIARNASLAAEATVTGQKETGSGRGVVDQTVTAINSLAAEVQQAAEVIGKLSQQTTDIAKVLEVIKGIAEQTNLLALNAAIEAARAGENGRGFAVVADEVRTLASRTTESAREIEKMIELLQAGSKQAVSVMLLSREKAGNSVALAAKAGEALESISDIIDRITDMTHQIAVASEEQGAVADEINRNIVNINQVAEATSEGTQVSLLATREMVEATAQLDRLISQFRQ